MSEWISAEDRLPNDCDTVIFYILSTIQDVDYNTDEPIGDITECHEIAIGYIKEGNLWINYDENGYYEVSDITHWMPLPEPPNN